MRKSNLLYINAKSRIPLYLQLEEIIRQHIEDGDYKVGDVIPNETVLQEKFKVSRATVRKAIEDLTVEGLLIKKQGKGTFVQNQKFNQNLNVISSFGETLLSKGLTPKVTNVIVEEIAAPQKIIKALELPPGSTILYIHRIYLVNDEPIAIMVNYLVPQYVPGLSKEELEKQSLYRILEHRYGLNLGRAEDTVESKNASEAEAKELNVPKKFALLQFTRVTYTEEGTPIEYVIAKSRGDRYSYSVNLIGRDGDRVQ